MSGLAHFFSQPLVGFILKLMAGIATAVFGIIGLGRDSRKANGDLSVLGYIALGGIVLAGLLAVGSSIYDYASSQSTAAEEKKQNQRLLLSVRRSIYPFRGITVDMQLTLSRNFPGLSAYKKSIKAAIAKDPNCEKQQEYVCRENNGGAASGEVYYDIFYPSKFFPLPTSQLNTALRYIGAEIEIARRLEDTTGKNQIRYETFGGLSVDSPGTWTKDDAVIYYPKQDRFHLFLRFNLEDNYPHGSTAYSLVDFMPGAMAATPEVRDILAFCDEMKAGDLGECRKKAATPLIKNTTFDAIMLRFGYPKEIGMGANADYGCDINGRQWLVKVLPLDVDDGTFEGPRSEQKIACANFQSNDKLKVLAQELR